MPGGCSGLRCRGRGLASVGTSEKCWRWEGSCAVVLSVPLGQVTTVYVSGKRKRFLFKAQFLDAFSFYFIITSFVLFLSLS